MIGSLWYRKIRKSFAQTGDLANLDVEVEAVSAILKMYVVCPDSRLLGTRPVVMSVHKVASCEGDLRIQLCMCRESWYAFSIEFCTEFVHGCLMPDSQIV